MKKYFIATLSVFILLTAGCKKDKNNNPGGCTDGSANFTHLAVGHELVYTFYSFLVDDTMIIQFQSNPAPGSYQTTLSFVDAGSEDTVYYHACGRDYYTSTNGDYNQYGHFWLSLDANVGDSWTRTLDGFVYNYKLFGKNVSVTAPVTGMSYTNCYKFTYNRTGSLTTDTIYFKPEIGIVFYDGMSAKYELARKNF